MNKHWIASAALVAAIAAGPASAADPTAPLVGVADSWTGFYLGVTAGGAWGQFDPRTTTVPGTHVGVSGTRLIDAAGIQTIKPSGFITGIEGGYNWQVGNALFGLEADIAALHLNGATNSGAVAFTQRTGQFTVTSYGNADWLLTARPRIGYVAPNHWLIYATGGLALTQLRTDFSYVDSVGAFESGLLNTLKAGYAAGGGIEAPLTRQLSIKAEYLHLAFANSTGVQTASNLASQSFFHSGDLKADVVRGGLNYRFDAAGSPPNSGPAVILKAPPMRVEPPLFNDWQIEAGTRLWLSTGSVGAPQPLIDVPPPILASRLVYSKLDAISGETFARVDHSSGFFVKGSIGAGGIGRGHLNDEDFPAGIAYSNTLSEASGHLAYGTIDAGYSFLKTPAARLGAFVGYHYDRQAIDVYGCSQLAGSNVCSPALPSSLLALTEDDHFNALRVGLSAQASLTDRLRLTAEAAYVPWVNFSGLDDHVLRQLLLPEASNSGDGVMLEAMLDYFITPHWSVGVGGRYWAWNMNTGSTVFDFLVPPTTFNETARFNAERYGVFVQTSYRWGDPEPAVAGSSLPVKAPVTTAAPMNWSGFYVGGHLGGGRGDGQWSDPFTSASTAGFGGTLAGTLGNNVAGFGDKTAATGPLGGGQIGVNWQSGPWVFGAQADASAAHLRGENTCFSGLGGINCMHTVEALGTATGRAGFAWDRSLAYVKGGAAWTATSYSLYGNTSGALALGSGTTDISEWGWTVGAGIEYALTRHWTALAEYDHIGLPTATVPFPTVALVNAQTIGVRQALNLFKLGVNYKFDLAMLTADAVKN